MRWEVAFTGDASLLARRFCFIPKGRLRPLISSSLLTWGEIHAIVVALVILTSSSLGVCCALSFHYPARSLDRPSSRHSQVQSQLQLHVPALFRPKRTIPRGLLAQSSNDGLEQQEDWRDFRAKLVARDNIDNQSNNLAHDDDSSALSGGWAYDAGTAIEKGSLVISKLESTLGCHDLNQPYFHKVVILLLGHDEEFTKGIVLNRPTDLDLTDSDFIYLDDDGSPPDNTLLNKAGADGNTWRMSFGGDIAGLFDEKPMVVCLHSITSKLGKEVSDVVMKDILVTSHHGALALVNAGEATTSDFYVYYGFAGWEPGMLLKELARPTWSVVATDSGTIWEELDSQRNNNSNNSDSNNSNSNSDRNNESSDPRNAGITMWERFTEKIYQKGDDAIDTGDASAFSDLMLKEWATEMCLIARDITDDEEWLENDDDNDSMDDMIIRALEAQATPIEVGTLVRGSSLDPSPYLLHDQGLHKSIVLLYQEDERFSVGLQLNHPTAESWSDGNSIRDKNIRHGGSSNVVNGEETKYDDEASSESIKPLIWLHCNQGLRELRIGSPLLVDAERAKSTSPSPIWTCTYDQAAQAIDLGLAFSDEFLLVEGFPVWDKEGGAGGIKGEVMAGNFEIVPLEQVDDVWSLLVSQKPLSNTTLDGNLEISKHAWVAAAGSVEHENEKDEKVKDPNQKDGTSRAVFGSKVEVSKLADEALKVWMSIFLLGSKAYPYSGF